MIVKVDKKTETIVLVVLLLILGAIIFFNMFSIIDRLETENENKSKLIEIYQKRNKELQLQNEDLAPKSKP